VRTPSLAFALACVVTALALGTTGCGGVPGEKPGQYPARAEGCDVQVFPEAPSMPTDNIGPVTAVCGDDISNDDCLRTLKDQTCKLGGDVVWGVPPTPTTSQGKKRLAGRAAHTKTAK
jgi:hypothetical protein